MPLDIQVEAKKLREMYQKDPSQRSLNVLLLGESGSGKSFLARTCRKPVHIDSFDPGGTKGLKKWIDSGEIIPDIRYEHEDPFSPSVFELWKTEFEFRLQNDYFKNFGTYILDSCTTWSESIMNNVLRKAGRAGQAPMRNRDYMPQKTEIVNYMQKMMNLDCDFILTGHLSTKSTTIGVSKEGEIIETNVFRFLTVGQGVIVVPLKFDEIWVSEAYEKSNGVGYRLLLQSTGKYLARSRLAQDGILNATEESDMKALLKKAGRDYSDKTIIK
jgi:hypothetical protein